LALKSSQQDWLQKIKAVLLPSDQETRPVAGSGPAQKRQNHGVMGVDVMG
jgi:hypothetical protein